MPEFSPQVNVVTSGSHMGGCSAALLTIYPWSTTQTGDCVAPLLLGLLSHPACQTGASQECSDPPASPGASPSIHGHPSFSVCMGEETPGWEERQVSWPEALRSLDWMDLGPGSLHAMRRTVDGRLDSEGALPW